MAMTDFELEDRRPGELQRMIEEMETVLGQRRQRRERVIKHTQEFASRLFKGLQTAAYELRKRGLEEIGEPRLLDHPAGNGRHALQVPIEDWSIIFVPLVGAARPNIRDEAQIPGVAFKEICGRVAVFIGSEPQAESFYDFLILSDGSWFAWGYGWPRQDSTMDNTDFELLAYALLRSFVTDIFVTWRTRRDTRLNEAMDARKRAYIFGLPGDEV
jgi:hypothetical protein